jgi:hypothetical protein
MELKRTSLFMREIWKGSISYACSNYTLSAVPKSFGRNEKGKHSSPKW